MKYKTLYRFRKPYTFGDMDGDLACEEGGEQGWSGLVIDLDRVDLSCK